MTEQFIMEFIPERIRQLGYRKFHVRYRDLTIGPSSVLLVPAFNELWFIVDDPPDLLVESGYGLYDSTGTYLSDNTHQHRGEITITNNEPDSKRIKFIQVIIVN